ncbi:hypothetical protein AVEN_15072-1 [Araneus ventricosus]|uniref:Uncharacterized protein n=1 Tax=Araneus ventricosus TaxID=182803 RepID=A0A4Y2P259_ARAVE|nr:hypothetical protein AVEN_15072-1 [Araneus ventricosus]
MAPKLESSHYVPHIRSLGVGIACCIAWSSHRLQRRSPVFPAEMVYGENLCLPSQFFVQQQPQAADNGFIKKLKSHIQQLQATPNLIILQNLLLYTEISVCVPMSFCVWTLFNLPCRNLI